MPSKILGSKFLFAVILLVFLPPLIWTLNHQKIHLTIPNDSGFTPYEIISIVIGSLQAVIYALTLLVISHQISIEYRKNKKNITIQAMTSFLDFKYELNDSLRDASKLSEIELQNLASAKNLNDSHKELRKTIGKLLDRCEHLSSCIISDIYDLEFINTVGGGLLIKIYNQFQPYIKEIRISTGNTEIYTQLEKLNCKLRQIRKI